MYHISDLRNFLRCRHHYIYSKNDSYVFKPYLRSDEHIIDLFIQYLGIENYFIGERNDEASRFFENIDNYDWFISPRFEINNLRFNIPAIHKVDDGIEIYFIYYNTNIKENDVFNFAMMYQGLKDLNFKINEAYVLYFNENYAFHEKLDVKKLFILDNKIGDDKLLNIIESYKRNYKEAINDIDDSKIINPPKKSRACKDRGLCPYYYNCFPEEVNLPDDSILYLVSSMDKNRLYKNGIERMKDITNEISLLNRLQYSQIIASKNNGLFVDKLALKNWLSKFEKPLAFVDFEWDRYLVPPFEGMKPMDALCFEYALYILDENDELSKYSFISKGDPRKEFLQDLLKHLPKKGSIIAYNAKGAELIRLMELKNYYQEYQEELNALKDRFIDLAEIFEDGVVYDSRMRGNFSLKRLVTIVSDFSYENLDIANGMEAVYSWRDIDKGLPIDEDAVTDRLKEYCLLDAYGLYLVYLWLVNLSN